MVTPYYPSFIARLGCFIPARQTVQLHRDPENRGEISPISMTIGQIRANRVCDLQAQMRPRRAMAYFASNDLEIDGVSRH